MQTVYEKLDKATALINANIIMKDHKVAGRIIVKYPKDGAGRLTVFIQEYGYTCIIGTAGGCGYDKVGAALHDAYIKAQKSEEAQSSLLYKALETITYDGQWKQVLKDKGFEVYSIC